MKEKFKVIVAGGREFNDYALLSSKLDYFLSNIKLTKKIVIVSGHASGADSLGEKYAKNNGYELEIYPAEWNKYGKSAGPKRNELMAQNADALAAFWNGQSRGTKHMIEYAKKLGLKVKVINY